MFSTKKATGAAGDKWLLSLGIDKLDGYDPSELTIDGVCAVFAFLQQFDPSIQLHCQVEGSPLPPLTVADRKKGFPTEIMMVLMYYFVERKWTLNPNQSNSSPSSPATKGYPNRVNGTLLVSSTVNLKDLVEMASIQLRQQGLHLYWKQVQMKDSAAQTIFLGIPDAVNSEGLELTLRHVLKKGQDYLIKRKIFDFNRTDEPLPVQGFSFRKHGEQRMPPEVYKKEALSNVKGYDPDVGIKLYTNEGSPKHWDSTMAPLFTWLEESGELNLIARRACLYEVPQDRPEMSDIISMQRNKVLHLKYSIRTNFIAVPEIATLEKEVELRYNDGRIVSPKFSTLREMMMRMVNPSDGRPLIESVLPLPKRRGYAQIMYLNRGGNEDLIKRMVEYPSAFWFHTWTNMGLTHDCVASLLDSFILEHRLFANKSTLDPVTWKVTSLSGRTRTTFADTMGDFMGELSSDEEDEVIEDPVVISSDARAELMATMKGKDDDLTFGGSFNAGDGPSRATNFSQSSGNSSHRKGNTEARCAAESLLNKELTGRMEALEVERDKERAEMEKDRAKLERTRLDEMERMKKEQELQREAFAKEREAWMLQRRAMESAVANPSMQHGPPPVSGGTAAGKTPSTSDLEPDGHAAVQG